MPPKRTQSTLSFASANKKAKTSSSSSSPNLNLKIITWNVNGIRAFRDRYSEKKTSVQFQTLFQEEQPDVVCFQETKIDESKVDDYKNLLGPEYPYAHFNCCTVKKGYAGTATFSKEQPLSVRIDFPLNTEGRVLVTEFNSCIVVNTYVPNSGMKLERLKYRTTTWDVGKRKEFFFFI